MTTTWLLTITADADVERNPECPACGETDCETVHPQPEETP